MRKAVVAVHIVIGTWNGVWRWNVSLAVEGTGLDMLGECIVMCSFMVHSLVAVKGLLCNSVKL